MSPADDLDQAEAELRAALVAALGHREDGTITIDTSIPAGSWTAESLAVYFAAVELVRARQPTTLSEFVAASGRHMVVLTRDAAATDPNAPADVRREATLQ